MVVKNIDKSKANTVRNTAFDEVGSQKGKKKVT